MKVLMDVSELQELMDMLDKHEEKLERVAGWLEGPFPGDPLSLAKNIRDYLKKIEGIP
jgi:hypothetical protein